MNRFSFLSSKRAEESSSIGSIWQSVRPTVDLVKIYRSPLLTGMLNRGQERDVLLRLSVDDRPLRVTFVCASFSIQRHVSKCFTPHIML